MVKVIFFDIDGILTDGSVYVDALGNETKRIQFDDIDAIFKLKRAGIKIGFITGEDNEFCKYVKKRFSPEYFLSGCKNKLIAFQKLAKENELEAHSVGYADDSKRDIELLKYVEFGFVSSNVDPEVKKAAKVVLKAARGQGVIKELTDFILEK